MSSAPRPPDRRLAGTGALFDQPIEVVNGLER
jgi:hypothetical protein